jgi:hypothetical protein
MRVIEARGCHPKTAHPSYGASITDPNAHALCIHVLRPSIMQIS